MNIALLGYGRMGKAIEQIALDRGHSIVFKSTSNSTAIDLSNADVAIDFSIPSVAFNHISSSINQNVPIVSGTTGWLDRYNEIVNLCKDKNGSFIYASNFSLGVNLFFEMNNKLAQIMKRFEAYDVGIEEIHHTQKLDAPSGTAISLANQIIDETNLTDWKLDHATENEIPITAKRIEGVPGTHTVQYNSEIDSISIKHVAHNRTGFALGAVIAAEWLQHKKGIYTMKDVLNLS